MANAFQALSLPLNTHDVRTLARSISLVENDSPGAMAFLENLPKSSAPVIGITGPPGAGKSTLVDALIGNWVEQGKKVGVLCVDPSSPFNLGALLGDRIRMSKWYNSPQVFIRSLATRGSLGGLHPYILEITDVMKAAGFDYVVVETVGVGQSEVEITGLADCTVVVLVPEAGDEIQTMKAGLMEIAEVFVVNKADRPAADAFIKNLRLMLAPAFAKTNHQIEIIKTIATTGVGIYELQAAIGEVLSRQAIPEKRQWLLADRAFHLIQKMKMRNISRRQLKEQIATQNQDSFNLYQFVQRYFDQSL